MSEYHCSFLHSVYRIISYDRVMLHRTREDGNVLFMILIAVVLFAALSYAVSQTTRGGGIDPSDEKAELLAAEILNYVTALQTAIMRLQVSNGCDDTEISFENSFLSGYTNPNAPDDKSCHVFDPAGAGLSWRAQPKGANNYYNGSVSCKYEDGWPWIFGGYANIPLIGTSEAPDGNELVAYLPIESLKLCQKINEVLKLGTEIPISTLYGSNLCYGRFIGEYTNFKYTNFREGISAGCAEAHSMFPLTVGNKYFFYSVLIAR